MKSQSVTIQVKATELYFSVVLFIMLYKVVLTFESVDEILEYYHSNESYQAVLSQYVPAGSAYPLGFWVKCHGVTIQTKFCSSSFALY